MEHAVAVVLRCEHEFRTFACALLTRLPHLQLCQDQEEERLDLIKSRLWDWSNALSTVAVAEDEVRWLRALLRTFRTDAPAQQSAERSRTALEQVDPATDLKIFVQAAGTGNEIPGQLFSLARSTRN